MEELTLILNRALAGDAEARERIYRILYDELLKIARARLAGGRQHSLNPSALVHEAYLKILRREASEVRDRRASFAYASTAMRNVLIDHARARGAGKRGGEFGPVTLTTGALDRPSDTEDFGRLNEALDELRKLDDRCSRVVEMRYFSGMTEEEIAEELQISVPTVKRDWRKARAFLFEQLR